MLGLFFPLIIRSLVDHPPLGTFFATFLVNGPTHFPYIQNHRTSYFLTHSSNQNTPSILHSPKPRSPLLPLIPYIQTPLQVTNAHYFNQSKSKLFLLKCLSLKHLPGTVIYSKEAQQTVYVTCYRGLKFNMSNILLIFWDWY